MSNTKNYSYKKKVQDGSVVLILQIDGEDSVCPLSDNGEPCVNLCVHHKTHIDQESGTIKAELCCFDKTTILDINNTVKINYVPIKGIVAK